MTPYYSEAGVTIYHADCAEVLEQWEGLRTQAFDLLLTDPQYGINAARERHSQKWGWRDYEVNGWDQQPPDAATLRACVRAAKLSIVWGGNYFLDALPVAPKHKWLVWDKGQAEFSLADCELAWCSWDGAIRRIVFARGSFNEARVHPTQKPEPVIQWALTQAPGDVRTVFDPFMGSGTTLVACKRLGREAVGIEREEKYCEIAAKRLSQGALPLEFTA